MRSAAPKTYISRRMIDSYSEQRRQSKAESQQTASTESQTKDQAPVVPPKTFAEDENATTATVLEPIEEEKKEMEQTETQGFYSKIGSFFSKKPTKKPEAAQTMTVTSSKVPKKISLDRNLSADELDSDELDGDLNLSDDENGGAARRTQLRDRTDIAKREKKEQYTVEFDTNIFRVSLDCLQNKVQLVTGDAEFCSNCKAVYNKTSVIVEVEGNQIWACEFCGTKNEVNIGEEEIPQSNEVTYLLEAAAQVEQAEEEKKESDETVKKSDKISVVFCIDISGSMSSGGRLTMCKQAIIAQIQAMVKSNPDRKIGLVTFENSVEIIGDGIEKPVQIESMQILDSYDEILQFGLTQGEERMRRPISETQDSLIQKVGALKTLGRTALGPGVLSSIAMASKGAPGSQVIICTDGMANVGLGTFAQRGRTSQEDATVTYEKMGQYAEQSGVMINLVTIAGTDANISGLSRLVELSGGQIEQVNPQDLTGDFASILSQKAIATKVEAKVKLHKGLQFRNELETDLTDNNTILTRRFGNVTTDSMFTFEYGMKPISELLKMEDFDMATVTHFPFQTQVTYTTLQGAKCLRVITQKMEISNEREELTEQADAEMVQQNVLMQGSKQARAGNTRKAQAIMKTFSRRTKAIQSDNWKASRGDFQAQTNEVYSSMNMQAMSMKMPPPSLNQAPTRSKMSKKRSAMQVDGSQMMSASQSSMALGEELNQGSMKQAPRMDDRMSSQMYQMSTKARRSKY